MSLRDDRLNSIVRWAQDVPHIRALIITGSLARNDGSADDMFDIDAEIITSDPATLEQDDHWLHDLGELAVVIHLNPGDSQEWATRLAIYADGTRVDFTLAGISRIQGMVERGTLNDLYIRGYRVLLDKAGVTASLPAASQGFPAPTFPTQEAFTTAVEEFWFEASHVPKYLVRGELWLVKLRDWAMKENLLRMAQWHTMATRPGIDTWHNGLRMRDWLEPAAWDTLNSCFARFENAEARRAFDATTGLYARLAREVAKAAGLEYPNECEKHIMAINTRLLGRAPHASPMPLTTPNLDTNP